MPSRRQFLALAATATTVPAGCVADAPRERSASAAADSDATTTPLDDGDRVRAAAPAIAVERDRFLDDETYVESNHTIRYPATMSGGDVDSYGHIPVGEWLALEAVFVAKQAVHERLESRLRNTRWIDIGATGRGGPETELDVVHTTYRNPDGPDDEPSVSAAKLVAVTPRAVAVTVRFRGDTATRTFPVFVAKWVGTHLDR